MSLPSTGEIKFSSIRSVYSSSFSRMGALYGVASGVPTSGAISFSSLRGTSASTPSILSLPTRSVDTQSGDTSGTYNFYSYVSDAFGAPFTYSKGVHSTGFFSSASVGSSSGILSYTAYYNSWANTTGIPITVTNRFSKSASGTVNFYLTGIPISMSSLGSTSLSTGTASRDLSLYTTDYSGTSISRSLIYNPYGNAYITSGILYVPGNQRGTSYSVTVRSTNGYSQQASSSLSVTESSPPPPPPPPPPPATLPGGSYAQSCYGCSYISGILQCQCQKMDGTYITTSKSGCTNFGNNNGSLVCE